jgi:hypothetical protein
MDDPMVTCPKCGEAFKLTDSLAAPIIEATRERFRQHLQNEIAKVEARDAALKQREQEVASKSDQLERQIEDRLAAERTKIAVEEAKKARLLLQTDLNETALQINTLKEALAARDEKLRQAQQAQAELVKKERELEDAKREVELTVQRRVSEMIATEREQAKQQAEESLQLKLRGKEEQIASMQRKIEELQKKAEQGSQQLQGEVLELELEDTLRQYFPTDKIEPVGKGELGADLVQTVVTPGGTVAGTIIWEIKNTRNWSDGWLPKLRNDKREINADEALMVSNALPKGVLTFDFKDGVWVTGPNCVLPVAAALREKIICVAGAKRTSEGQSTKMERLYDYLTGTGFRDRVEAVLEQFSEMEKDLSRERRFMERQWAKRGQQIHGVIGSTAGLHGDLEGIVGQSMLEIEGLCDTDVIDAAAEVLGDSFGEEEVA